MSRRTTPNVIGGLVSTIWLAIVVLPIYYVLITSLRQQSAFYTENPLSFPSHATFDNYRLVWESGFLRYLANSAIVTVASVAAVLALAVTAAYVVVRSRSAAAGRIFSVFLLGIAIPIQATIIPVYYMVMKLRLYDTLAALILPSVAFAIPLTVLILVNFMRDIPGELFESMWLDGAGDRRLLFNLVLPLTRPALVTVAVYDALTVWNGFLFPLILTQSADKRTLPLSLWTFQGQFMINIPAVLAAVVLSAIPLLAAYAVGRRQLVQGITAGFGK
jgi:raffinose/stachyose/melibiose transport system permease protein